MYIYFDWYTFLCLRILSKQNKLFDYRLLWQIINITRENIYYFTKCNYTINLIYFENTGMFRLTWTGSTGNEPPYQLTVKLSNNKHTDFTPPYQTKCWLLRLILLILFLVSRFSKSVARSIILGVRANPSLIIFVRVKCALINIVYIVDKRMLFKLCDCIKIYIQYLVQSAPKPKPHIIRRAM